MCNCFWKILLHQWNNEQFSRWKRICWSRPYYCCEPRGSKRSQLAVEGFVSQSHVISKQRGISEIVLVFGVAYGVKIASIWPNKVCFFDDDDITTTSGFINTTSRLPNKCFEHSQPKQNIGLNELHSADPIRLSGSISRCQASLLEEKHINSKSSTLWVLCRKC